MTKIEGCCYSQTVLTKAGCQTTAARRPSALMKNGYVRYVQYDAISSKRYTYFYFLPISPHNHLRNCLVVVRVLNILCLPVQSLTSRMARLDGYCRMHGLSIDNIDRCIRDKEKKTFLFLVLDFMIFTRCQFLCICDSFIFATDHWGDSLYWTTVSWAERRSPLHSCNRRCTEELCGGAVWMQGELPAIAMTA